MVENLSEEQMTAFKEAFQIYGTHGELTIASKDLGKVMRALGTNPTESELVDFTTELDPEGMGSIDFPAFVPVMKRKLKDSDTIEELFEAFKVLDKEGIGRIPSDEFRYLMVTMGEKMREEEVDDMVKEADGRGDGFILWEEYAKHLMKIKD